jgi:hypothetical protein
MFQTVTGNYISSGLRVRIEIKLSDEDKEEIKTRFLGLLRGLPEDRLERLHKALTGGLHICKEYKIVVVRGNPQKNKLPEFHTCFATVDIAYNQMDLNFIADPNPPPGSIMYSAENYTAGEFIGGGFRKTRKATTRTRRLFLSARNTVSKIKARRGRGEGPTRKRPIRYSSTSTITRKRGPTVHLSPKKIQKNPTQKGVRRK